jgi:tetratricopeptide (TPR) repeat protein
LKRLALLVAVLLTLGASNSELEELERKRERRPSDPEVRQALAEAYYRHARTALDASDFEVYETYLGRAMDEAIESARLDPESAAPHVFMGIVAAYQGDIRRTFQSLANARRLSPRSWVSYTNLAEVLIYKGSPRADVVRWNNRGEKLGADPAIAELNLCLVSWRDGNLPAAERHFRRVRRLNPAVLESWHEAPVDEPIETLSDLMGYCCASPACGPYLEKACSSSELEVAKREIPEEVARRELVLEMERRRKLEAIYEQRKDLEIQIEPPEPVPAPAP